jgi:hypothetical protein
MATRPYAKLQEKNIAVIKEKLGPSLGDIPRWLLFKFEKSNGTKKPGKIPYYANGRKRSGRLDGPRDQSELVTLDEAIEVFHHGNYHGIGLATGPIGDGRYIQAIDLDKLEDHQQFNNLKFPKDAYIEKSPGLNGKRVIGIGKPFKTLGANETGIEAYAGRRFVTVTGIEAVGTGNGLSDLSGFVLNDLAELHGTTPREVESEDTGFIGDADELLAELESALKHVDADSRELWIDIGLALSSLGREIDRVEECRELWIKWSQTSDKHNPDTDPNKWDELEKKARGEISYRTIFAKAQDAGWINPAKSDVKEWDGTPGAEPVKEESVDVDGQIDAIVEQLPRLMQMVYQQFMETAPRPQKIFGLFATIALFCILVNRNARIENIYANFFFFFLGPTGCGKDAVLQLIGEYLEKSGLAYSRAIASGEALHDLVMEHGVFTFLADEFKIVASEMRTNFANVENMLYSAVNRVLSPRKKVANVNDDIESINNPFYTRISCSTVEMQFDANSYYDIISGNTTRSFLIFSQEVRPEYNSPKELKPLRRVLRWTDTIGPDIVDDGEFIPWELSLNDEAEKAFDLMNEAIDKKIRRFAERSDKTGHAVYVRAAEQVKGLALVLSLVQNQNDRYINLEIFELARAIVRLYASLAQGQVAKHVYIPVEKNETKVSQKVEEKIKEILNNKETHIIRIKKLKEKDSVKKLYIKMLRKGLVSRRYITIQYHITASEMKMALENLKEVIKEEKEGKAYFLKMVD